MKVLHIITDLLLGGAESVLVEVASRGQRDGHANLVVSLTDDQPLGERLRETGIRVMALNLRPNRPDPRAIIRLARMIRAETPDLIQTWMYHGDLLGSVASLFAGRPPIVWGIHHTAADPATLNPRTRQILKLNARLSRSIPTRIICCAESAKTSHAEAGYRADRMTVIPNGVDVTRFQPDPAARAELRAELGLTDNDFLIGLCARFHPTKDHATFIKAARDIPDARFLLCGRDVTESNSLLMKMIDEAGIRSRCHLLGPRNDMPRVYSALDLLVSSSRSEAFPLTIAEAMACGRPCVVTDVGDSAVIIGETGRVVPAGDPPGMAEAVASLRSLSEGSFHQLGALARERAEKLYNLEFSTQRYWKTYQEIMTRSSPYPSPDGSGGRLPSP